jgi:hypothetical protein
MPTTTPAKVLGPADGKAGQLGSILELDFESVPSLVERYGVTFGADASG